MKDPQPFLWGVLSTGIESRPNSLWRAGLSIWIRELDAAAPEGEQKFQPRREYNFSRDAATERAANQWIQDARDSIDLGVAPPRVAIPDGCPLRPQTAVAYISKRQHMAAIGDGTRWRTHLGITVPWDDEAPLGECQDGRYYAFLSEHSDLRAATRWMVKAMFAISRGAIPPGVAAPVGWPLKPDGTPESLPFPRNVNAKQKPGTKDDDE